MISKFFMAFLLISVCSLTKPQAQLSISFNIGLQPIWGPVGYERADNYYLPDIETYYNVKERQYTYMVNGVWVSSFSLPPNHRDYDLYGGHKVVINGSRPYLRNNLYRERYANFRNRHDQPAIRDSRDSRYFENKDHPRHVEWKQNGHDNRDRNGNGNQREENRGEDRGNRRGDEGGKQGKRGGE